MYMSLRNTIVVLFVILFGSLAFATPVEIGIGSNIAGLYIEWGDSYNTEFLVHFESATITGLDLFDIVESNITLTTDRKIYGEDIFIDGISFNGHSNAGYAGGENWWHYWTKDAGQSEWTSPAYGAADRELSNGDYDGWIYGRASAAPEPATIALLAAGLFFARNRKS
jgi:hypothetical protein